MLLQLFFMLFLRYLEVKILKLFIIITKMFYFFPLISMSTLFDLRPYSTAMYGQEVVTHFFSNLVI